MRTRLLVVAALAASALPAAAVELPTRKPGLWELKMLMEGHNLPPQTVQHCIDAATDKLMNTSFGSMTKEACSKQDIEGSGSNFTVDSVCKFGPMTSTTHAVVSGSFDQAYTVKVVSHSQGGPPQMPAETHMTIEAKWLGACAAGQKPGDMMMPGGMKINILDMQAMRGRAQRPR